MNAPLPFPSAPSVIRILVILATLVLIFDVCFWGVRGWGVSEAVFSLALAAGILCNRPGRAGRRSCLILALAVGAAVANLMEPGFCNTVVWLVLIVGLAGETFFTTVGDSWGRFLSQVVAMIFAPGRPFWLLWAINLSLVREKGRPFSALLRGCLLTIPAASLTLFFGCLLAEGNAVFGVWMTDLFHALWTELMTYLNLARIGLWLLIALAVLPLIQPAAVASWWWTWTQRLPRFGIGATARSAVFSSGLVLVAMNVLFLTANVADVIFLWHGASLPPEVTYSQFVHQGVEFLIATVLLSAFVLTAIFQQELEVVRSRLLRGLALTWIAQNLFLILSVALRLKRYIEAYGMSVERLGLIIFLVLVTVGFGLLAMKIRQDRSLSWLLGACLLAVFGTFYVTQFLNLAGWTANFNLERWEKDRTRNLDVQYLQRLGPAAWPAVARLRRVDHGSQLFDAATPNDGRPQVFNSKADFSFRNWREFYLRAWLNRDDLDELK